MKELVIGLISFVWFLNACAPATQARPPSVISNSATPSSIPTATQTSLPTETPTPSITPLPTIPTFTPTFDVSTIITVTPAPKAECPKEDPSVVAKFATPDNYGTYEIYTPSEILDYLNSGGVLDQLQDSGLGKIADITGDGLNEVVYKSLVSYAFFGCKDGKYQDLFHFAGDFDVSLEGTIDLNKNGIPELILYNIVHYGYFDISVFEWDGNKFQSLINIERDSSIDPTIDWVN